MNLTENDQGFINGLEYLSIRPGIHELVEALKEYNGIGYDYIFISTWEDDSDDLTGWHDHYFNGFRIDMLDYASNGGIHVNNYGLSKDANSYYLTEGNLSRIRTALLDSNKFKEFLDFAEYRITEQCKLGLKSEIKT